MILIKILILIAFCYGASSKSISKRASKHNRIADRKSNDVKVEISDLYITTPGIGRHKLHSNGKTWEDARVTCLNEGAHLAVIKSAEEETLLLKKMKDINLSSEVWIGVHEQFKKDDWVTVQDQRLDSLGYINWGEGQPDAAYNNTEHCATIMHVGGMNDLNCESKIPFYCKTELTDKL